MFTEFANSIRFAFFVEVSRGSVGHEILGNVLTLEPFAKLWSRRGSLYTTKVIK